VPTFVRAVDIDAPVSTVFAFHEREDALPLLSPPFPPVRVVSREGGIAVGARVELRIAGLVRWVARHTAFERDRLFVDEQLEGPFARWTHRHEFEDLGGRTRLTDRITYALPGGRFTQWLAPLLVTPGLHQMFRHRHRVTRAHCEAARY
jgi:ligand-binding SRPBCC domain-containing protein